VTRSRVGHVSHDKPELIYPGIGRDSGPVTTVGEAEEGLCTAGSLFTGQSEPRRARIGQRRTRGAGNNRAVSTVRAEVCPERKEDLT